ncbi:septum formation family protein [Subtercola sp. PAMC28395]|uniref:septum formation family protein n=1 Tax=Subtercola sp. PAMC28395 TaxID=2846775 RepID=UPI001C0DF55E|nr:septum formation family protein [Subtercola sp. PAMC28395]QWT24759.1 septum formation family protein [Subtercola sp. PAMC28395]
MPVGVAVVAVLVLGGLFFLGTRLPGILSPVAAPSSTPTVSETPTPSPTPVPTSTAGPQLAGSFYWNELRGGECISPFTSAWQQKFTVVDCSAAHSAQVTSRGSLGDDPAAAFPGQAVVAAQLNLLCQQAGAFDPALLAAYPDVVWQAAYPVNDAQWKAGMRDYYCFVSRTSSGPISGNFAAPAFRAPTTPTTPTTPVG